MLCATVCHLTVRLSSVWNLLLLTSYLFPLFLFCSSQPEFYRVCHTKAQYDEEGPRIARHSPVFSASM